MSFSSTTTQLYELSFARNKFLDMRTFKNKVTIRARNFYEDKFFTVYYYLKDYLDYKSSKSRGKKALKEKYDAWPIPPTKQVGNRGRKTKDIAKALADADEDGFNFESDEE
ncbi:uncharacterized protein MYCFIDRAFT_195682 [Pseudocercospora fijiensis CIRAD86]|uniref:Uncharacterized protein n=1 Tax=Pseudocercospora fijiensis (strain CIRAD86) TaxID=383855 RepID=M3AJE2_PSEFD|nr:uncharacterized protein MYCFIDRAFT_195682 [Pseudocercospora fijiensis CIRAD86]EME84696.1 hypothetical protein MYCFIDRAFT_195682 [Pseudocercospora fijiensis CIRAD86]